VLGEGSFGRVYRAYDPSLDREVALKVPTFPTDHPELAERFLREARAAARLRHPNIVAIFEIGQGEVGLYIASEFVAGQTLSDLLASERTSLRRAVEWVRTLALALQYAHEEGVVHRDVKPANIMIDTRGRAQLMDFGLAKRVIRDEPIPLVEGSPGPTDTAAGTVLGTPSYMAPEQARGEVDAVGPHSDQYSLGVVLYELLAGRRPFDGSTLSTLREEVADPDLVAQSPRRYNRQVPAALAEVCLKAIAKQPWRRYESLGDFAVDLQRWLNEQPVSVQRPRKHTPPKDRRWIPTWKRAWTWYALIAALGWAWVIALIIYRAATAGK
jgi:serine/threonine protein kinase